MNESQISNNEYQEEGFGETRFIPNPTDLTRTSKAFEKYSGKLVSVRNESGDVENDWIVTDFGGKLIGVTKGGKNSDDNTNQVVRYISIKDFEFLNPID